MVSVSAKDLVVVGVRTAKRFHNIMGTELTSKQWVNDEKSEQSV